PLPATSAGGPIHLLLFQPPVQLDLETLVLHGLGDDLGDPRLLVAADGDTHGEILGSATSRIPVLPTYPPPSGGGQGGGLSGGFLIPGARLACHQVGDQGEVLLRISRVQPPNVVSAATE